MAKEADITKDVPSRSGRVRRNVVHLVFSCKGQDIITIEKGSGYTNPYRHMKSCISRGDNKHVLHVSQDGLSEMSSRNFVSQHMSFMTGSVAASERENAMHAYLRHVILNNYTFSHVQNDELRIFSKRDAIIEKDEFKSNLFKLVELAEGAVKRDDSH